MRVHFVSDDPMLLKSVELMLADPALGMRLSTDAAWDHDGKADLYLIDAEVAESRRDALRRSARGAPVIVIATDVAAAETLPGFEGADCLVTPFHRQDLIVRIHAAMAADEAGKPHRMTVGSLTLDMRERRAEVAGETVPLTGKEFDVLAFLAMRRGVTVTKDMFLDHLYGGIDEPEVKIIDVFVCKIRRKLKALTGGDPLIQTVWGRGYVLPGRPVDADAGNSELPATRVANG